MRRKNKDSDELTQESLLVDYFEKHPRQDIPHPKVVDWATAEYQKRTGKVFRDPDRGIRKLYQRGLLIKVGKGVYRYEPSAVKRRMLDDFSPDVKKKIFERDGYRCVVCGRGNAEGFEIHADHIKPRDVGGASVLENGQTLCSEHNFLKKNYRQTGFGKKLFVNLYESAKAKKDKRMLNFCSEILQIFEKYHMDDYIVWKR